MRIDTRPQRNRTRTRPGHPGMVRGATTLIVVIILLVILSIIVLFSTNVAFFEQRTTTAENRARIGEQAAEFSLNVTGEWLKSKLDVLVSSNAANDGWLSSDAADVRWAPCTSALVEIAKSYVHPCEALEGGGILATSAADPAYTNLYFYARGGVATGDADISSDTFATAYNIFDDPLLAADPALSGLLEESNETWTVEPRVQAVLCRVDSEIAGSPRCRLTPNVGNNIAITLISGPRIDSESTEAVVMETWATYGDFNPASAVPLVASGTVKGLGNAQVVGSPNAGGFGLAATMWSPCAIEISGDETQPAGCEEPNSSGIGSVSSCHIEGFLASGGVALEDMLLPEGCAGNNNCGCPGSDDRSFLSGHAGATKIESYDVLDRDGGQGAPDITFFPGSGLDDPADASDDNLFEWIFGVDYASKSAGGDLENDGDGDTSMDCGTDADQDCAVYALENDLGAQLVTCDELDTLADTPDTMAGIYYVTDGDCDLPTQLGGPDNPVVVVVDGEASINGGLIYGMLFVRSPTNGAVFSGTGNPQVFGSVVVEGHVDMAGGVDLIYVDWAARGGNPELPPPARNFGRVSGSWIDASRGL